jgi:ribosomal protein L11 methyltransferase
LKAKGTIRIRISGIGSSEEGSLWARKGIEEGAEGAEEKEGAIELYFDEAQQEAIRRFCSRIEEGGLPFENERLPEQDWNREWEANFHPIFIGDELVIRAPFHPPYSDYPYRILVRPERAFGTGHHPTTRLMLEKILELPIQGKEVLDMGCGTGILAMLCEMRGAKSILAVDNDQWAVDNAERTVEANGMERIRVQYGSGIPWKGTGFDVILGNIQRDPLLDLIPDAAQALNFEGLLVLSGLRNEDLTRIQVKCVEKGLVPKEQKEAEGWVMLVFQGRSERS